MSEEQLAEVEQYCARTARKSDLERTELAKEKRVLLEVDKINTYRGPAHVLRQVVQNDADLQPQDRAREQRAWNWYDWANSAYYTTILTVLFAPYLITVAGRPNRSRASRSGSAATEADLDRGLDLHRKAA